MTDEKKPPVVYVVADLWPLPDKMQQAKKILYDVVPEAKKERTCLKYELCENLTELAQLTLLQAWSNEHALEAHLNGELIKKATEDLRALLTKPTEIRRYTNIG
jgi:quinol monooxygenase YgiN